MAKQIIKFLDALSLSEYKLNDLPRKPDGLYNLAFNPYGQLVKRAGYSEYNTTAIDVEPSDPNHKIVGMHRFYKQDITFKEFIVAWNTSLYKLSDTSPHGATPLTGCPALEADADTYFADFANHCYIVNGVDTMMKYNMTNVRTDGIAVPGAPTDNSRVSGSLTEGVYYFCYTFVDEDGYEGNGGTASAAITVGAGENGIKINIAISDDPKIAKRRIYRTTVGDPTYYYDGEVADNTTLTYDSTISDEEISLKSVLHSDHNAPPGAPHLVAKRRSRINIAVDDDLYVSKNYDKTTGVRSVEYFPSTNYYPTGNGQKITGLLEQLTGLPVYTEDSIERLTGTDEYNFEFKNSYATEGNIAIRSLVNCDNLLVFLEFDGIHYFDGVSTGIFSEALNEYIKNNINRTCASLSCATYYDDKYLLCYPKGASTVPSETIYIDLRNKTYGIYSFDFSCFSRWDRGTDGLQLFGGSNTVGRVYKVFDGLDDDGSNITAYDSPEPIDLGLPEVYKQWYSIFIKVKTTSGTALAMYYTLDNGTETSANMVSRDDIAFVDGGESADTITTVAGDFVATGFKAGDVLVVTGTDSNNGNMTIVFVVAKTITLATGIVTAEAAGAAILTKALILTADTTKWYRISLGSGGKLARALKPRPYMSDKFNFEIHGYMICFETESFAEEKE